ncbi:MAG: ATP-binding cassette domain-containing protein [Bdellovibrionaceae bacterium]|nr:ATP-binding cassette domain-containing protein [Pseudobdellovibrionaceae bacterium]
MIEVNKLCKRYGNNGKLVVNNISFSLGESEIVSIVGPSGCGKTTTLKMINRLIEPTSGSININAQHFTDTNPVLWRRKIGYVIQKSGLLPHLTVEDNITLISKVDGGNGKMVKERARELMDIVNLPYATFARRYPIELSGGQQQRVGIARSLMANPPLIIMDEPFGALDPITKSHLHDEFLHLNESLGKTILIVTHDLREAFKLSDRVILMNNGTIEQIGKKNDFIENPANLFVTEFMKGQLSE